MIVFSVMKQVLTDIWQIILCAGATESGTPVGPNLACNEQYDRGLRIQRDPGPVHGGILHSERAASALPFVQRSWITNSRLTNLISPRSW